MHMFGNKGEVAVLYVLMQVESLEEVTWLIGVVHWFPVNTLGTSMVSC